MKVSVVVPVYKVEEYLPACLDSLLDQGMTAEQYEIIVVDDGSPDGCGAIADRYAAAHSQIRVIHQANRGLSGARNVGIEAAKGEYLWFVDSDDFVMSGVLPRLVEQLDANGLDKLLFNYVQFLDGEEAQTVQSAAAQNEKYSSLTFFDSAFEMNKSPMVPEWKTAWNYLVRTDVLKNSPLRFVEKTLFEDKEFNFWLDRLAGKSAFSSCVYYFYRNRSSGIVHSAMSDELFPRYAEGRIKLAERKKQDIADLHAGKLNWLRVPLCDEDLELRYIHEVQGLFKNLFEKGDRTFFESALQELKQKQLYPYPIRISALRLPGQSLSTKLLAFLFPVEAYLRLCFAVFSKLKKH